MATAMLPKKKLKSRSKQRSTSSRAPEEEDEDMVIISKLESEPWQPDLLLERQSGPDTSSHHASLLPKNTSSNPSILHDPTTFTTSDYPFDPSSATTPNSTTATTTRPGFQGIIPVIIKSPSSVITTADSDCVESVFEDQMSKIPAIQEYLEKTQTQQLQQPQLYQLQYQLPSHLQRKQLYRNSFHGLPAPLPGLDDGPGPQPLFVQQQVARPLSAFEGSLDDEEDGIMPMRSSVGSQVPLTKVMGDNEEVAESLQSLKNLAMLALDGLLQQVVSDITASDPVHNPDETTLQARALIRKRSNPLLSQHTSRSDQVQDGNGLKTPDNSAVHRHEDHHEDEEEVEHEREAIGQHLASPYARISDMPISGMATSSLERLDELARKVDQLTVIAGDATSSKANEILHEPLDIPMRSGDRSSHRLAVSESSLTTNVSSLTPPEQQQHQHTTVVNPSQIFESQEYQLACALAALLACIYRILNRMQEPRMPLRTESADSGLDQASRLWKRLSSNSFTKNALKPGMNNTARLPFAAGSMTTSSWSDRASSTITRDLMPSSPEKKANSVFEQSIGGHRAASGFMQSFNRQVKTLRSRRTQSTSQIEMPLKHHERGQRLGYMLGGLGFTGQKGLCPEDGVNAEVAKELDLEWSELDKLMDDMSHLWQLVVTLEQDDKAQSEEHQQQQQQLLQVSQVGHAEDATRTPTSSRQESDPFHDRHQTPSATMPYTPLPTFDQQTLEMAGDELPQYDDHEAPQYRSSEKTDAKPEAETASKTTTHAGTTANTTGLTRRASRNGLTGVEDEKTRVDLNNVMSAIERLSRVAPRMDNQRVQLSPTQTRHLAEANISHTIERLSRGRWEDQRAASPLIKKSSTASASASSSTAAAAAAEARAQAEEKNRDLNKLVNQIVESAKAGYTSQRAEFSPRQQWKLEGARIGDKIERGEKMRMSDQDWQSPEKVLLKDMTRLTNALYQQSATSQAFATQRFTLTEDKARTMALQGIISKIERLSDRRMENQDALPPPAILSPLSSSSSNIMTSSSPPPRSAPAVTSSPSVFSAASGVLGRSKTMFSKRTENKDRESNSPKQQSGRIKSQQHSSKGHHANSQSMSMASDLPFQDLITQVMESGGGPTRRSTMATQRAEFSPHSKH